MKQKKKDSGIRINIKQLDALAYQSPKNKEEKVQSEPIITLENNEDLSKRESGFGDNDYMEKQPGRNGKFLIIKSKPIVSGNKSVYGGKVSKDSTHNSDMATTGYGNNNFVRQ